MLAWIPVIMVMGFLGGCAVVIATSGYQLIKSISKIPSKPGPLSKSRARAIEI